MSKISKSLIIIALILILLLGIGCIVYSPFASWYNERHKAQVYTQYQEVLESTNGGEINDAKEAAILYNQKLYRNEISLLNPEENGYYDLLNIAGNGIMGYLRIPAIDVNLAIYHGVSDTALSTGAGHMPQTSLPIGGESTHAALSAHSGLASNALFSELERLQIGDYLYIDILDETLAYQVDRIKTVLPDDISSLAIEPGQDYVTLITCVPYGVNTHRLLVRGTRVTTAGEAENGLTADGGEAAADSSGNGTMSIRTQNYIKSILYGGSAGIFLSLIVAIIVIILAKRNKKTDYTRRIKMKKFLAIMLTLSLALPFSGCHNNDTANTEPSTEPAVYREPLAAIERTALFEGEDIKITAADMGQTEQGGEIGIILENSSDMSVSFSADDLVVNGITVGDGFCVTAAAKETVQGYIKISYKSMDAAGISNIASVVSPDARIFENEEFTTLYSVPFRLETSISGTHQQNLTDLGIVTYEGHGLRVTALEVRPNERTTTVRFLITNGGTDAVAVKGKDFTADGTEVSAWMFDTVYGGTSRYCELELDGIVTDVSLGMDVYSAGSTYELLYETGIQNISQTG